MARDKQWLDEACGEDPVVPLARKAMKSRLADVARRLKKAAKGSPAEPELVHRLRTASRRAAAAVEFFRPLLPKTKAKRLLKRLKKIRSAAGRARDLDVLLARLASGKQALPAGSSILAELQTQREDAHKPLKELHRSLKKGRRLKHQAKALVARIRQHPRGNSKGGSPSLADWTREHLVPRVRELLDRGEGKLASIAALHQFRIEGKQVRYSLELIAGALAKQPLARLNVKLRNLQDRIGVICDHAAAVEMLSGLFTRPSSREDRKLIRREQSVETRHLSATHKAFLRWWTPRQRKALKLLFVKAGLLP